MDRDELFNAGGKASTGFDDVDDLECCSSCFQTDVRRIYSRRAIRPCGMSLIEVIFAATFLCLIFMAMINILPLATFAIKRTEHRINASAIAQSMLEDVRAKPFSQIDSQPATAKVKGPDETEYTVKYEAPAMETGIDATKLRRIVVTVSWKEREITLSVTREIYLCNVPK